MRGFAPRKHPAPGLQPGLHRKTTFCFSASTCRQTLKKSCSSQHNTCSRQPANSLSPHSFHTSHHNLTLARNLHSGLTGQHTSALIFSFFFFHSTPHKKRKPAKPISISFSNPKFSPNLVQASPSQSLSLLFSPSNQYTLLHKPRSCHT